MNRRCSAAPRRARFPHVRGVKATWRIWLPIAAGMLCLLATNWAGAIVTWVLLFAGIALLFDGLSLLWSRSSSLGEHRQ
jgi:hypothetical protein